MLSAAKQLVADRDRPFASLRVTRCDGSHGQVQFAQIELCLSEETCEKLGLTHDERAFLLLRSRVSNSSWVSLISAPITFSSRCFTEDGPGLGSIELERWRSQASSI